MKADVKEAIEQLLELRVFASTPRPTIELSDGITNVLATLGHGEPVATVDPSAP